MNALGRHSLIHLIAGGCGDPTDAGELCWTVVPPACDVPQRNSLA